MKRSNRFLLLAALIVAALSPRIASSAINNADYTTQIEAADVLSRFLTDISNRADERNQAMTAFLRESGATREYTQQKKPFEHPQQAEFEHVYRGAIEFIKNGGDKLADPSLAKLDTPKLIAELNVLNSYAAQQFLALDMQQKELKSITAFLESTKRMEAYRQWAAKKNLDTQPAALAELPTAAANDDQVFARGMADRMKAVREAAWDRARASGQTAEQFDQQWERHQQQLRRLVGYRLAAIRNANQQQQQQQPGPALAGAAGATAANPPINDPRWHPFYYGPTDGWNWQDIGGDAFSFRGGSGTYRQYDQRLNRSFDLRLDGTYDQRVNIDTDRRLNIHQDPREGI